MGKVRSAARQLLRPERSAQDASLARLVEFRGTNILCSAGNKLEAKLLSDAASYDLVNFAALTSIVRAGDVCLDIGANIGIYSAVMSRLVGREGQVHSFEPVKHIRRKLRTNLALNGGSNVTVNSFALGDQPGSLEMFQIREGQFRGGTSTFVRNNNVEALGEEAFEKQSVEIKTLDSYPLEQLDFVKLDVEGFEINVLKGGRETLRKFHPAILFEHDQPRLAAMGMDEREIATLLDELGYSCFEVRAVEGKVTLAPFEFTASLRGNNLLALHVED